MEHEAGIAYGVGAIRQASHVIPRRRGLMKIFPTNRTLQREAAVHCTVCCLLMNKVFSLNILINSDISSQPVTLTVCCPFAYRRIAAFFKALLGDTSCRSLPAALHMKSAE